MRASRLIRAAITAARKAASFSRGSDTPEHWLRSASAVKSSSVSVGSTVISLAMRVCDVTSTGRAIVAPCITAVGSLPPLSGLSSRFRSSRDSAGSAQASALRRVHAAERSLVQARDCAEARCVLVKEIGKATGLSLAACSRRSKRGRSPRMGLSPRGTEQSPAPGRSWIREQGK